MKKYLTIVALILPLWSQQGWFFELPSKDSYVYQNSPDSNYGTEGQLYIYSNHSSDNTIARSLMKFNLSSLDPGDEILGAVLDLYMFDHAGTDFEVEVHRVLEPWNELTVTWDNQPIYETECAAIVPYQGYHWAFYVTDLVQYWVDHSSMNHGLMLKLSVEQYPDSIGRGAYFYSRDTSLNWERPLLWGEYEWGVMEETASDFKALTLKPNPARGSALLCLSVAKDIYLQVTMYDIIGREIKKIHDGIIAKGSRLLTIDTDELAAGTYFIKVNANNFYDVKPLVIIR